MVKIHEMFTIWSQTSKAQDPMVRFYTKYCLGFCFLSECNRNDSFECFLTKNGLGPLIVKD